jgi:hypothetical protein
MVHAHYDQQVRLLTDEFDAWKARVEALWNTISDDLAAEQPDIASIKWPQPKQKKDEHTAPLFDSKRDYLTQIEHYKKF